jgi:hypothetical protein
LLFTQADSNSQAFSSYANSIASILGKIKTKKT